MLPEKGATVNCAGIGHHLLTLRPEPQRSSAEPARHLRPGRGRPIGDYVQGAAGLRLMAWMVRVTWVIPARRSRLMAVLRRVAMTWGPLPA